MDPPGIQRDLQEGIRLEQALRWEDAESLYRRAIEQAGDSSSQGLADLHLRHANALLQLRRTDEARVAFDRALDAAKTSPEPLVLARALLGAGVFAATSGDFGRGEEFLLAALRNFHEGHGAEGVQGEGWALLNLAAVYGKTRRLDLAFVTFDKARERLLAVDNWVGVGSAWELQAELREKLGDRTRAEQDFHEAMVFYARQGMTEKVSELGRRVGGRRVV